MNNVFSRVQMLETSEDCNKFSKSVSYETLVGGTTTTGRSYKQIRRLFLSSADKPLTAVGTLTSLLCNSAKVMEKLLRHVITRRTSVRRGYLPEKCTHANEESLFASVTWFMRLPRRIQRMLLVMTIPALAFLLSLNLSKAFAADCVPETTIINDVEKPLVECHGSVMEKFTYDSSGNVTNHTIYNSDGSGWKKYGDSIYTYDSSGNLESEVWYRCDSGNCEQEAAYKYKLDTAPNGTKIAKEIAYWCSNGVCEKNTESEMVYAYNDDTFTILYARPYDEYWCGQDGDECDTEFPQSISATPFCPKGCNGCDVERACSSCAEGYKKIDTWCNKIRWTPAEAAKVLRNDNTNEVTITFRK